jgi:DNA-binding MarR family transcriptional regulator
VHLHVLNRALEARAYEAVVAAGFGDITPAQARLLARVGEGGTRLVELADRALVTKQTAGHLVDQLERAGYVERTPDPTDGRARLVRLTARAHRAVPVADAEVRRVLTEWSKVLGPEPADAFADALARLAEVVDPFRER